MSGEPMWVRLKCTCGYEWWNETPPADRSNGPPLTCPRCRILVDTVSANGGTPESAESETIDSHPPQDGGDSSASLRAKVAGYEIHNELGRGGMGVVYRAFSRQLGRFVALKALQRIDPVGLERFKQEFRVLADVNHPNLVTLFELVSDGTTWFFTMELVEGVDFQTYASASPPGTSAGNDEGGGPQQLDFLKLIRIRRGLAQLASAVAALHRANVLHRDIKPSNVLVTSQERLVLLDFGLAAELEGSGSYLSTEANVVGTVAYMSPEQAAGEAVSEASDWYSVGVMLYEGLTGTLPITGKPLAVLQKKQTHEPAPPSRVIEGVPTDLDELCTNLLRRDPANRPSVDEILHCLNVDPSLTPRLAAMAPLADESPALVGRERHWAVLDRCYRDMERGVAAVLAVRGSSGMGKTSLVQAFLDDVRQRHGAIVLAGRCYEQESVPFKALDSLIDALSHYLRHAPVGEVEGLMPRDVQALTRVFPVLGRVAAVHSANRRTLRIADQQELRRRAVAALREMLARLGDRHPLVVFIDDLQWGDVDSASVLCELIKPPDAPLLMFVGAYRAEDEESSPFLRAFRAARDQSLQQLDYRDLTVGPLKKADCRRLAQHFLARDDIVGRQQAEMVARESGGSPLFVRELARFLESPGKTGQNIVIELDDMIVARVGDLPHAARRLLEILAVAGRPVRQEDLLRASGLTALGPDQLSLLKVEHLIRTVTKGEQTAIETYHDRVREALVAHLTDDERRETHRCWAETMASTLDISPEELPGLATPGADRGATAAELSPDEWQRIFDLAFHLDASGDHQQALPYALAAAGQARAQHSLQIAQQQYRIAQRGAREADNATRFRLAEGLGDVLMLRGRYEEAARLFHEAAPLAEGSLSTAKILGKRGELAFKQGDMKTASSDLEQALRLLGKAIPRSQFGCLRVVVWETLRQILHTQFPKRFLARRSLHGAEADLLAARLLGRLGHAYWFKRGALATLAAHLKSLNLAEKFPPTPELAQCYSEHAPAASLLGLFRRSVRYAKKSYDIRHQADDAWGQAQSLHFYGIALYTASRFRRCIEKCTRATRLFDRTGDYWELNMARYQIAASLYRLGDLKGAYEEARKMHASGLDLGDAQASSLSVDILSKAARGDVASEVIRAELDRPRGDDAQTASQVLQAEGVRLMTRGEYEQAADVFQNAYAVARRAGVMNTYVIPSLPWLATALRRRAEALSDDMRGAKKRLLRRARQAARCSARLARRFQNDLPHALRERALLAAAAGRYGRAFRWFEEGLAVAERQGARYEHAQTLLAFGEAEIGQGLQRGRQRVDEARAALREIIGE